MTRRIFLSVCGLTSCFLAGCGKLPVPVPAGLKKPCTACRGSGKTKCIGCQGTGRVSVFGPGLKVTGTKICESCKGEGGYKCILCGGAGRI